MSNFNPKDIINPEDVIKERFDREYNLTVTGFTMRSVYHAGYGEDVDTPIGKFIIGMSGNILDKWRKYETDFNDGLIAVERCTFVDFYETLLEYEQEEMEMFILPLMCSLN